MKTYIPGEVAFITKEGVSQPQVIDMLKRHKLRGRVKDHSTEWSIVILEGIENEKHMVRRLMGEAIVAHAGRQYRWE